MLKTNFACGSQNTEFLRKNYGVRRRLLPKLQGVAGPLVGIVDGSMQLSSELLLETNFEAPTPSFQGKPF